MNNSEKPNKQLMQKLAALKRKNAKLEALEIEHRRMEGTLRNQTHDLTERIKEINCLYGMSKLVEKTQVSLEDIYQGVVNLISSSWQYPEITCARLTVNGNTFSTKNFKESPWKQSVEIIVYNRETGTLDVCYLEEKPLSYEGPFLKEERSLINAIGERLGRTTERKQSEKALNESEKQLKKQNVQLQEKNIALREVMNQLITEKKNLEERVLANVDQLVLPLLKKLKSRGSRLDSAYINLLEDNLAQLTSPFGSEISRKMPKLTPRENEICNMIRSGLSSKEVARLLNISYRSVETYRNYIRKKLGIINTKINLTSYLASI
ncbi:MAG: helix-turn-helix transcriptional regulator [Desulfobacterales bacterium]|nr:helix-turn-helix transcriptional regulator [Desulfobacterales bacterium]